MLLKHRISFRLFQIGTYIHVMLIFTKILSFYDNTTTILTWLRCYKTSTNFMLKTASNFIMCAKRKTDLLEVWLYTKLKITITPMFKDICSAGCGIHDGHDANKHRHAPSIDHDPPHGRSSGLCRHFDSAHPGRSDHDTVGQCELFARTFTHFAVEINNIRIWHIQSNKGSLSVLLFFLIIFAGLQIWFYLIVRRVYDYLANVPPYQGPGFVRYGVRFN